MAGIKINAPFELGAAVPVDTRLTLSKAEMLTVNDNVWPDKYLTVCSDDGAIYLYDKTNTVDPTTGKFRILSTDLSTCLEKVSTMPAASLTADPVMYVGATTSSYVKNHLYEVAQKSVQAYANTAHTDIYTASDAYTVDGVAYYEVDTDVYAESKLAYNDDESKWYVVGKEDELFVQGDVGSEATISVLGWFDIYNLAELREEIEKRLEKASVMPTASATTVGEFVMYTGATTSDYITGHVYKGITDGDDPATYSWVDISPDNFQFTTMPTASELQGKVVQYIGETTTVAPIYVKGHFYQSVSDGQDPATWSWSELDTEADDYDHIENRPLELTRGAELYNDTVTLDAGDTTSVTLTDKVLVADKKYIISVDGTEHEYTATLDSSDDSININASDIGIVISTADSATDSTMVLTNAEFASDPAIIVKEANIVAVNSDYQEFFDNLGKESALSTDVTANTTVGGFEEDDIAPEGMTFTQFATKLLHVYKEPTLAFTSTASTYLLNKDGGVVEQPFTLTATATKQDLDIVETWIEDAEGTKLATGTTTASYVVESNVYDDVTYKAFTKDAKKTIAPKTISYEFIYGFFKGTSATVPEASADVKALTLDLTKKSKKEYTFTASNQYLTVAYPASYGNLTKIVDQNKFDNTGSWNKTVVAVSMNVWDDTEGDYVATDVNYNVYTTNDKITCSNFKYTFEF